MNKFDAQLAPTGGVEFMYTHIGRITYNSNVCDESRIFEIAIEAGASDVYTEDVNEDEKIYIIETGIDNMIEVEKAISKQLGKSSQSAEWFWKANEYIAVNNEEFLQKYQKLIDALEDLDDVSNVYSNLE